MVPGSPCLVCLPAAFLSRLPHRQQCCNVLHVGMDCTIITIASLFVSLSFPFPLSDFHKCLSAITFILHTHTYLLALEAKQRLSFLISLHVWHACPFLCSWSKRAERNSLVSAGFCDGWDDVHAGYDDGRRCVWLVLQEVFDCFVLSQSKQAK